MYEEFICIKINKNMTVAEKDQASRRFLRKAATHALNALQDTREEFINKYLEKYHAKIKQHQEQKARRAAMIDGGASGGPSQMMKEGKKEKSESVPPAAQSKTAE